MKTKMNRRSFVSGAALGAGACWAVLSEGNRRAAPNQAPRRGPLRTPLRARSGAWFKRTRSIAFRGVPYGASTEGANRFMPPVKPESWTGIKETVEWGPEAPQGPHTEIPEVAATIPKRLTISEDCLHLNVWTNGLDARKRPVMVWLHGGGFTSGNGSYTMYDGGNMARKHDMVNVTIESPAEFFWVFVSGGASAAPNSRMPVIAEFWTLVAALEWVRDNIANFGGDPNNVTIFGQSGGAGKVSTLLAMPSAKGLVSSCDYSERVKHEGHHTRRCHQDRADV